MTVSWCVHHPVVLLSVVSTSGCTNRSYDSKLSLHSLTFAPVNSPLSCFILLPRFLTILLVYSSSFLADCIAAHYDRLLASSCRPSVCLLRCACGCGSRSQCTGQKLHQRVPRMHVPFCPFRHFCCRVYRLATKCTTKTSRRNTCVH